MKHLKFLAFAATILAAATLTFSACSDDESVDRTVTPESGLLLEPSIVNFGVNGGTESVTVTETKGSVSWEPIISGDNSAWLTVTKTGSGVEITAASNAGNIEGRSASIAISDVNITVTQDWDSSVPAFWIQTTNFSVSSEAQEITISTARQAITNYVITSGVSWFSVSESGTDIIVSAQENTGQKRSGTFEVSAAGTTEVVRITISQGKSADLGYLPPVFEGSGLSFSFTGEPGVFNTTDMFPSTGSFMYATNYLVTDKVSQGQITYDHFYSFVNSEQGLDASLNFYYSDVERGVIAVPQIVNVLEFTDGTIGYTRTAFIAQNIWLPVDDYAFEYDPETREFTTGSVGANLIAVGHFVFEAGTTDIIYALPVNGWVNCVFKISEGTKSLEMVSGTKVDMSESGIPVLSREDLMPSSALKIFN